MNAIELKTGSTFLSFILFLMSDILDSLILIPWQKRFVVKYLPETHSHGFKTSAGGQSSQKDSTTNRVNMKAGKNIYLIKLIIQKLIFKWKL